MKRFLALFISFCLLFLLVPPFAIAEGEVNIQFNSMDNSNNLDMEPDNGGVKSISVQTASLEGSGAVRFTYKSAKTGGLFWYLRTPDSSAIDISNSTHIIFDMYISDANAWNVNVSGDKRLGFREVNSSTWDTSAGQVVSDEVSNAFTSLKTGWNHIVLPITLTSNTAMNGIRMYIAGGSANAGFYSVIDDIRFVNDEYLSSDAYLAETERKDALIRAEKGQVLINFNNMDSTARQDMESAATKEVTLSADRLEGAGAVKFGYKAAKTSGGHFWYFRCYESANTTGVDISGATHVMFNIYVSDMNKWTRSGDSRFALRSVESSTSLGSWDTSCGQVTSDNMSATFDSLKNGWNRVILPLDTSTATSTRLWGVRMYFAGGTGEAGFYTIVDDIRFVNQDYLNSAEYAQKCIPEDVMIKISRLPDASAVNSSHIPAIQDARADYNALSEANRAKIYNLSKLTAVEAALGDEFSIVDIPFRSLDSADRTAHEAATSSITTTKRVEGSGAAEFEIAVERSTLCWYIYCDSAIASTGVNITKATHIIFDFYVNDLSLIEINKTSDMQLSVRNVFTTGGWDTSCTYVTNEDMHSVFNNLTQGWNHIALPIQTPLTNDAFAIRILLNDTVAKQEFVSIIDDIRFVNQNYLQSIDYANIITAKKVAGKISELTKSSSAATLYNARAAYNNLTDTQKSLVCNYDWLTTFEAGNDLPENATKTFSAIPSGHLANRQNVTPGEFSLAVLSDLHYAVNYNGQEKDVFYNSIDWILNNAQRENTLMALQLGDITSSNRYAQWQNIRPGFQKLVDGGMPYATVIGNHDIGGQNNAAYNHFLPYSEQVSSNPYLAGAYEDGKTDNLYYTFRVNDIKYMVLTLTCYPKEDVLTWADNVIKAHADHNVILVTHSYLRSVNGVVEHTVETEALAAGFTGASVWNSIIKPNPNVLVTLSAHNSYPSPGGNAVGYRVDTNDYGRNVYQFLVPDPQTYEATYGGLGSCFLMRFSNQGKTLSCEYISTRYDKDIVANGNSNHVISLDAVLPNADKDAAQEVIDAINTLPNIVTLSDENAIVSARNEYNNLTDVQKGLVTNLDKLTKAEQDLETLKEVEADKEVAKSVDELIGAIGEVTLDSETDIQSARMAYENLSETQKSYVTKLSVLENAETTLEELILAAQRVYGDLTNNGEIDVNDALMLLQFAVGKVTPSDEQYSIADLNGDGNVNVSDALLALQKAVGKIDKFPIEQ